MKAFSAAVVLLLLALVVIESARFYAERHPAPVDVYVTGGDVDVARVKGVVRVSKDD